MAGPAAAVLAVLVLTCITGSSTATRSVGGEASFEFTNYAHQLRFSDPDTGKALNRSQLDPQGWPLTDVQVVFFDARPTDAWHPPIDDPDKRQPDLSGRWKLVVEGNASVAKADPAMTCTLGPAMFNASSNQLTMSVTFPKGKYPAVVNLLVLSFKDTQRTPGAAVGSGLGPMQLIHPDYADQEHPPLFTDNWAKLHSLPDHLRWMGTTGTNSYSWLCGGDNAYGCSIVEWEDRALPTMPFYSTELAPGAVGHPWEFVLLAANQVERDVWINVPVTASDRTVKGPRTPADPTQSYVYQLAKLFRDGNNFTNNVGLKPHLNIYVEHSNEVWNFGFKQYSLNKAAATYEVNQTRGRSNLVDASVAWENCSYTADLAHSECWAHRRHARRVAEIADTFEQVFGHGSINTRIRPVYASWTINPQSYYNNTLTWLQASVLGPKLPLHQRIYAMACTAYFGPGKGFTYPSIKETVAAYFQGATNNTQSTQTFAALKQHFGLKLASYEGGPGADMLAELKPGSAALGVFIEANRDAGMKEAVVHDARDVWFANGGDIYNYFSLEGMASHYGCWGATEDWRDISPGPPKLQGLREIVATEGARSPLDAARG